MSVDNDGSGDRAEASGAGEIAGSEGPESSGGSERDTNLAGVTGDDGIESSGTGASDTGGSAGGSGLGPGDLGALSWPEEPGLGSARREARPRKVLVAIVLIWAGAATALVSALHTAYVRFFVPASEIERQIVDALEQTEQEVNPETIAAMDGALSTMMVVNFVAAAVWVLMAVLNARGIGWARMTATVLAVLNVPWTMLMAPDPLHLVGVATGLAAVLFLWMPASREWFAARSGKA